MAKRTHHTLSGLITKASGHPMGQCVYVCASVKGAAKAWDELKRLVEGRDDAIVEDWNYRVRFKRGGSVTVDVA